MMKNTLLQALAAGICAVLWLGCTAPGTPPSAQSPTSTSQSSRPTVSPNGSVRPPNGANGAPARNPLITTVRSAEESSGATQEVTATRPGNPESVARGTARIGNGNGNGNGGATRSVSGPTALDRYIAQPDPSYGWKVVQTSQVEDVEVTVLEMTSQTWLTTKEVDKPVWKHRMTVYRPREIDSTLGLLMIGGGSNADTRPARSRADLIRTASATRTVVTELGMVPNQPLVFGKDGKERFEDDLIAYTWDKFLRTGDERWPARLPMTKAAVRAMDTITAFCASAAGGGIKVDRFVVAGGSKRGWTTWTTAAVDPRVVAICPIVIDVLNIEPSMIHHYKSYGFFAPAVGDYVNHKIMDWMGTPEMAALRRIEDPFEYRDRFTQPKLILNAAGDQFFLPDSSQFYFSKLPGPKYLRYVPNTDHSMNDSDAAETVLAWQYVIANNIQIPHFDWVHLEEGVVEVRTQSLPEDIILWKVANPLVRDFRLETIGPAWGKHPLMMNSEGVYRVQVDVPAIGWAAYFVELQFDVGAPTLLKLTTDIRVVPETLPHPAPSPARPQGFMSRRR